MSRSWERHGRYTRGGVVTRVNGHQVNRYPGDCSSCGELVPAGEGILRRNVGDRRYVVTHRPAEWRGSPVSGRWAGGCPGKVES